MRLITRMILVIAISAAWALFEAGPPYASRIVAWFSQLDERLSSIPPGFWLLWWTIFVLWHFYEARQDELALRQQETQRLLKDIAEHTDAISRTTFETLTAMDGTLDRIYGELQDLNNKKWR
jgi:hypothetical protein